MPLLTTLPLDIQHRIISFLLTNRDIAALSIQCRSLHAICNMATREKYRRVRITEKDESFHRAFTMLMDILKRPSLGRYLRHIECVKGPSAHIEYPTQGDRQREMTEEDMRLLRDATRKAGFVGPQTDRVVNMVLQESASAGTAFGLYRYTKVRQAFIAQALAALLISVSPDLESMALAPPYVNYTCLGSSRGRPNVPAKVEFPLSEILKSANSCPEDKPFLQNLRSVYVTHGQEGILADERFYICQDLIGCMMLFHRLPSIESVSTDVMQEDENGPPGIQASSSNITRIAIRHSSLDSIYLVNVISSCKVLKEFQHTIGGRSTVDGGYPHFNPKTFIQAILMHRTTLEVLDVDVEAHIFHFEHGTEEEAEERFDSIGRQADVGGHWTGGPPEALWEQSGSLRDFGALRRLSLGINFLLYLAKGVNMEKDRGFRLVECLPPNLEYLLIRGYERGKRADHDTHVNELLAFKESGACNVRHIEGVEELTPHARDVEDPDNQEDLLWTDDGRWHDELK